jgi:hypothetical protein
MYSTVCLDKYTDEINKSFFSLNWVDMVMSLMSWAQYYNTSYSNPYNTLNLLNLGMPKDYSKEYLSLAGKRPDCERTMTNLHHTNYKPKKVYEVEGLISMNNHCNKIGCQWRDRCETYALHNIITDNLINTKVESLAEHFASIMIPLDSVSAREYYIHEFGGRGDYDDNFASTAEEFWIDTITLTRCLTENVIESKFEAILLAIEVISHIEDGGELADMDGERPEKDMKELMIRWATERG